MALFRRKKAEKPVTKEVEQYIKAEKRERAGLAWLLALVSLAIVSLVILGLFFGGKWAYNRFVKDDNKEVAQTQTQNEDKQSDTSSTPSQEENKEETTSDSSASNDSDTNSDTEESASTDSSSDDDSDDEESAASDEKSDEKEPMPQTGPSQPFTLAILVATISTLLYRFRIKQRA